MNTHHATLLTAKELAQALHVGRRTIGSWTASRRIPCYRISARCVRYDLAKVREALEKFEQIAVG